MDQRHDAEKFFKIICLLLQGAGLHSTYSFWLIVKIPWGGYNQL